MYVCIYVCEYVYMCICINIYSIYPHIYVCMYVCVCVCIHIYEFTYAVGTWPFCPHMVPSEELGSTSGWTWFGEMRTVWNIITLLRNCCAEIRIACQPLLRVWRWSERLWSNQDWGEVWYSLIFSSAKCLWNTHEGTERGATLKIILRTLLQISHFQNYRPSP